MRILSPEGAGHPRGLLIGQWGAVVDPLRGDAHDQAFGLGFGRRGGAAHVSVVHLVEQNLVRVVGDRDMAADLRRTARWSC